MKKKVTGRNVDVELLTTQLKLYVVSYLIVENNVINPSFSYQLKVLMKSIDSPFTLGIPFLPDCKHKQNWYMYVVSFLGIYPLVCSSSVWLTVSRIFISSQNNCPTESQLIAADISHAFEE